MQIFVTLLDASTLEVRISSKEKGYVCIEKVFEKLGVLEEKDYFGLQFYTKKGERVWLNTRNRLNQQLPGFGPHQMQFLVKFFAPPHVLILDVTRDLFYLNIKKELSEKKYDISFRVDVIHMIGMMAQVEIGDHNSDNSEQTKIYKRGLSSLGVVPDRSIVNAIEEFHRTLRGMTKERALSVFLKEASLLEGYGVESFSGRGLFKHDETEFQVGVFDIKFDMGEPKEYYDLGLYYSDIMTVNCMDQYLWMRYLRNNMKVPKITGVKLTSATECMSVYRAITEKYAFFNCRKVHETLLTQYTRRCKGFFRSIFRRKSSQDKMYIFDLQRTCMEVYRSVRRDVLEECRKNGEDKVFEKVSFEWKLLLDDAPIGNDDELDGDSMDHAECSVCMDEVINTVFLPCGHIVTCNRCAGRVDRCPMCRKNVEDLKYVNFPTLKMKKALKDQKQ